MKMKPSVIIILSAVASFLPTTDIDAAKPATTSQNQSAQNGVPQGLPTTAEIKNAAKIFTQVSTSPDIITNNAEHAKAFFTFPLRLVEYANKNNLDDQYVATFINKQQKYLQALMAFEPQQSKKNPEKTTTAARKALKFIETIEQLRIEYVTALAEINDPKSKYDANTKQQFQYLLEIIKQKTIKTAESFYKNVYPELMTMFTNLRDSAKELDKFKPMPQLLPGAQSKLKSTIRAIIDELLKSYKIIDLSNTVKLLDELKDQIINKKDIKGLYGTDKKYGSMILFGVKTALVSIFMISGITGGVVVGIMTAGAGIGFAAALAPLVTTIAAMPSIRLIDSISYQRDVVEKKELNVIAEKIAKQRKSMQQVLNKYQNEIKDFEEL